MNSCTFIVKIVSTPEQRLITNDICLVETRVQFAKLCIIESFDQFQISIWGILGENLIKYFREGDYIIIEGILSFKPSEFGDEFERETKMTVLTLYPFLMAD